MLNGTFEPLCVVPARRAACLVIGGKAEVVIESSSPLRSAQLTLTMPSVVKLRYVVKAPHRRRVALNRRAVFARDDHRCQYCGAHADSIDHVFPRSRGGTHTWDNVVAACRACNIRKRDRLLEETTMRLARRPLPPRDAAWIVMAMGRVPDHWLPFLGVAPPMRASLTA